MFSIAAINETESDRQWEQPLAPTKEAQEFFLSQKYHDGLLKMQEKDFAKARELLEEVLRDPLISDIQAENGGSDHHLRQLRFLSLKNLASVFLQLGPDYNENAMQCYLQAVELDWGDVVVWNQLGTLSCSMGSLGMARWAFEQGLRCSPTNWICMEKLMEVLIAIRDEVQCLAVSKRLLEKWPSHSRAMYVKSSIEGSELGPHGFDKLEPKHPRLKLKRKLDPPNSPSKRIRQDTEVQLMEATWSALLDRTVSILTSADVQPYCTVKVCIDGGIVKESDGMDKNTIDRTPCAKENEASATDKEQQSQERRSTRLERLRSRKSGKDEFESGRDTNLIAQNLEQFILKQAGDKEVNFLSPSFQVPDVSKYTPEIEANDVKQFIELISGNCNAVQLGNLLLEEFADLALPYRSYFIKLPELDRLTRQWGKERSQCCHMYLAEVFFDLASLPDNKLRHEELLSDSNYHICKIIEHVASNLPESVISEGQLNGMGTTNITPLNKDDSKTSNIVVNEIPSTSLNNGATDKITDNSADQASSDEISSFWARFYWITGCLSLASGDKGRAYDEFNRAISFLKEPVLLLHCANGKLLTIDRINCELNSLKLDFLLRDENEPIKKVPNTECIKLLPPLLFSTKDVKSENQEAVQLEVSALDLLILACEKEEKMKLDVYLECHKRKLQLLIATAGVDKLTSDSENVESSKSGLFERTVGVVRDLAKSLSTVKSFLGKGDCDVTFASLAHIIADIQALLLTVVQGCMKSILSRRSHVNKLEQIESRCLVDAAISFCKLQQLDPSVTIKSQVDLIVMVHELLAEYGLCCAGKDSKGEEGTFLKFAIDHLLALKALHCTNSVEEDALHDEQNKDDDLENDEVEELESCIDGALDQSFFCLYGLNMNPDSTSEEDLVTHQNTSRGDYQTKEQCADVFHYILPYARTLSRSGLVKLRRVLRAIRKHFHQPPNEVLANNAIDVFLDGPDSCEKKLFEIYESNGDKDAIMNIIFQDEGNLKEFEKLLISSSEPNLEVYRNLYYLIVQAEDTNATDKYAGFVLKKEGEEFVEQNANLLKYDLLYNPLRFKSWQKLANIYDEEVDLLLNDGSKHMSISDWKKNTTMHERVHTGRRRSRRCLLMSLVLASTADESETHELLALVYYDSLQNVVPFYDQRSVIPTKDAIWTELCRSSMKHFEKAIALEPEWLHAFYLGKLCEKLGYSPAKAFLYYAKAGELNPTAVDPVYRLHASRLKLLYTRGKQADLIQIVAAYAYKDSTKETILSMLGWKADYLIPSNLETSMIDSPKERDGIDPNLLDKVWLILYDDCISALGICVEGELKHFHKARYKIAQGLHRRGDVGDLERAKEELSFCFKSSRSSFTVNMWEIDGTAKKGRKKNLSVGGSKKNLEVSLSESSRKFISCIRKYMLLYLNLLEKTHDLSTLERAYNYLRTDKRFYLCIMDMIPVALGKYIQVLVSSIQNASDAATVELLLEKMFSAFMDHASMWGEVGSLPEVDCPELSETNLFGYIHQFIQLLESDLRLHQLESINEKIRKRFKNPKLSNSNLSRVCKHASLAWCRCLLVKLASITPVPDSADSSLTDDSYPSSGNDLVLYVDLQPDELLMSSPEGQEKSKGLDMNLFETLSRVKNVQIRQATEEKMEEAVGLLRSSYNFYRESSSGTFPAGINLYTVLVPQPVLMTDGVQLQVQPVQDVIGNLDLSIPRKLLLWAYTLVHGRYSNISTVVKYCEEMKIRTKKGLPAITGISPSAGSQDSPSNIITSNAVGAGGSKEKGDKAETVEAELVVKHKDEMEIMTTGLPATSEPAVSQPSVSKVDFETAGTCSTKEKGETDEMQEHKHAKQHEALQEDCGGNKDSNSN